MIRLAWALPSASPLRQLHQHIQPLVKHIVVAGVADADMCVLIRENAARYHQHVL